MSDVNEVIQKMISQESTAENLMILTKENQVHRRYIEPSSIATKAITRRTKLSP